MKKALILPVFTALLLTSIIAASEPSDIETRSDSEVQQQTLDENAASDGVSSPPFDDLSENPLNTPPDKTGEIQSSPVYIGVIEVSSDQSITGKISANGIDESAVWINGGNAQISEAEINRSSDESTGGGNASFFGIGSCVLTTSGTVSISDTTITSAANGAAGVFAYGSGIASVSNTTIETTGDTSGGIHVSGGGTMTAAHVTATTYGESSAAIRSDRGGGILVVDDGTFTTYGNESPAVYCTADITINNAIITANNSEALCIDGKNIARLNDCVLTGTMQDLPMNDSTWTVILYQSMSGESEIGEAVFEMSGGTLNAENGGVFYTTNTDSVITLKNVTVLENEDCEYLLNCCGNSGQRDWGIAGSNGANCVFTAVSQTLNGNILYDSISNLNLYLTEGSNFTGAIIEDNRNAGNGGDGGCNVYIDGSSVWIITDNSHIDSLSSEGIIADSNGNTVSIAGADGALYVEGTSPYTITVNQYSGSCDLSGAHSVNQY